LHPLALDNQHQFPQESCLEHRRTQFDVTKLYAEYCDGGIFANGDAFFGHRGIMSKNNAATQE
jgi:hypothetical protein